jgi:hypothetical protein
MQSIFVKRLSGLDFWNKYCMAEMITPIIWGGSVAKLIIVALTEKDSHMFRPQILSAKPMQVDESFQLF